MIPDTVLRKHGAIQVKLRKGQSLFLEGDPASFFYIVKSGRLKMASTSADGREFVQGYFTAGESFGEPPFFTRTRYPAGAIATEESVVWKCGREHFLRLLKENFDVHLEITRALSNRLAYKAMMLSEIAVQEAEHRLKTLIEYFRSHDAPAGAPYVVPFTRQQLADLTGLRVETVIRTIKQMERSGLLRITRKGKITWLPRGDGSHYVYSHKGKEVR